ncbi:Accessory gene regulator protein B [Moorella humiferrea]
MLSIHDVAGTAAAYLVTRLPANYRRPEVEVVAFGLEVLIGGLLQLAVFVATARYLGLLPEMTAALVTMATYRLLSGGPHCSAYYRCLILSALTLNLLAFIGHRLAHFMAGILPAGFLLVYGVSLLIARRLAPRDTEAAPIISPVRRARLKTACYLWLLAWLVLVLLGYYRGWSPGVLIASMAALTCQSLSLTPLGFTVVGRVDRFLKRLLPLG